MKSYTLEDTKLHALKRVVDRNGNWEHYLHTTSGKYLRGVTTILNQGYTKGKGFEVWLSQKTPEEQARILSEAGNRGDKVHRFVDMALNGEFKGVVARSLGIPNKESGEFEPLSNDEWDCIVSFFSFWNSHKPIVYANEIPFFNLEHGYAGTGDLVMSITEPFCKELAGLEGKVGLWDIKTSSGIRPSYSAQTAAYAYATNVYDYIPAKEVISYTAIVRIGTAHKKGYEIEVRQSNEITDDFQRFLSAKQIADFGYKPFDPEKQIYEIPDVVTFEVKKYEVPKAKEKKPRKLKAKAKTHAK